MPRPLIGVVAQTHHLGDDRPAHDGQSRRYTDTVARAGGLPVIVPLLADDTNTLDDLLDSLDGLLLAGGMDVEPNRYGETRRPECGPSDPDRDRVEIRLAKRAVDRQMPLLAVCRGLQLLNVACGGSLYQDIPTQVPAAEKHDCTVAQGFGDRAFAAHMVTVKPNTRLADILGTSQVPVNSIHHQAVKDVGQGLVATGFAPDGIIESMEGLCPSFCLAVQWHPEELAANDPGMFRLFTTFVAAAGGR
jgi:putative glutamine amidotransferase